ncbi:hypothetical protein ZIOFF_074080 [Zingiber officinale]|uniref:At2g23090-like zinc-binding domain-containing protein n=1 Tax=Zingiber officinale TaxID=94328 RepID=A0A8J5EAQ8_ZINOF|nr:hypothetical protein ZIOFF_074080 [Zingiber officinale]
MRHLRVLPFLLLVSLGLVRPFLISFLPFFLPNPPSSIDLSFPWIDFDPFTEKKRDGWRQWPEVEDGAGEEPGEEQTDQGESTGIEQKSYEHSAPTTLDGLIKEHKYWEAILCKVCMQTFICTTSEVKCREHAEAKHPKNDVYQCFPHLKN